MKIILNRLLNDEVNHLEAYKQLVGLNDRLADYGLYISAETAEHLLAIKQEALLSSRRYELDHTLLDKLILSFADSPYLLQETMVDTLEALLEIFFYYKAECLEAIDDQALIDYMTAAFNGPCGGSLELLGNLSLYKLSKIYKGNYLPEIDD